MKYVSNQIAEQIRKRIWDSRATELKLVSCTKMLRPVFAAPDPANMASAFPAVGVIASGWKRASDDDWMIGAVRGVYLVDVLYVTRFDVTLPNPGEQLEIDVGSLCELWKPHELADWWESIEGFTAESLLVSSVTEDPDEELAEAKTSICGATISLQVTGISHPTGPVSYPARKM